MHRFVLGQPLKAEESRRCEYKEVISANPVNTIKNTADEYAVAYLNSGAGSILWGVCDADHVVVGVRLSSQDCDQLKRDVNSKLTTIQPPVDPAAFTLECHYVYESLDAETPLMNLRVVELTVEPRPLDGLYATSSKNVFLKTDSGKKNLTWAETMSNLRERWRPQPNFMLQFETGTTVTNELEIGVVRSTMPPRNNIDEQVDRAAAQLPYRPMPSSTGSLGLPLGLAGMNGISEEQYRDWRRAYTRYLHDVAAYEDEYFRTVAIALVLANTGDVTADDIVIQVSLPSGFIVRSTSNRLSMPIKPEEPRSLLASIQTPAYNTLLRQVSGLGIPDVNGNSNCRGPLPVAGNDHAARFEIYKLVHNDTVRLPALELTVPPNSFDEAQTFDCQLLCRQIRSPMLFTLSISIKETGTQSPWSLIER